MLENDRARTTKEVSALKMTLAETEERLAELQKELEKRDDEVGEIGCVLDVEWTVFLMGDWIIRGILNVEWTVFL